ncbi:PREDICTED: basic salivary proline-rich protein 1-like [Calidris pugnax]|uniref:basic salivary proline-rich protein 1-like n=1 Tax=Calidris pugnax TaxID=198806 RepID=UPI00071D3E93|nr:PREDICTED: basic salivary proline-rich protein 1-like [Calidris pugnax]
MSGYRRGFPREPRPWAPRGFHGPANFHGNEEDGRWAPHDCPPPPPWDDREDGRGPEDRFKEDWDPVRGRWAPHDRPPPPPWDDREDGRGPEDRFKEDWDPPGPWYCGPAPDSVDFPWDEEDRRWASHDRPPPPPWDDREDHRGPEGCFEEDWHPPGPWYCGPAPDSVDFPWDEEDRRWASHDRPPPPPWDDREDHRGPEGCFEEDWHPDQPGPNRFSWPEFPGEEEHPRCPPGSLPGDRGGFHDGFPSRHYRDLGRKRRCLHRGRQKSPLGRHLPHPRSSRGDRPSSGSSQSRSATKHPGVKEEPQRPDPPQPLISCKDGSQSSEQMDQSPPVESGKVPEPPGPAADPGAVREAAEPEQAAGVTLVEQGTEQKPMGSHSQSPSASEMEPASPEESSAGTEEHPEVEPCSQSAPKAGAGGGSRPHTPTAPPEPERVCTVASSAGEVGAELCPGSQGWQHLPSGAGEAETEDVQDGLLGGLWPSKNSQVLLEATVEPDAQPSSDVCTPPETPPGTQDPSGSSEAEAVGTQHQLCSTLPASSPAGTDLRSAAVLARKEEIELSYQQFSLTIAVVATMLLQKEPSMEAALGLALRANLRQGRIHHLQELEDFINSYDSATLSH